MQLENWIEQLVEEPFMRLFAGQLLPAEVARRLVTAMEDGERLGADGTTEVPCRYRIAIHSRDLSALQRHHPDLSEQLSTTLRMFADRVGVRLTGAPVVLLESDDHVPPHSVHITLADRTPPLTEPTQDITRLQKEEIPQLPTSAPQAYIVIGGQRTVDLSAPVLSLGRALDNDIILEDRGVSRHHARLRRRYGHYVLEDLGSTGGTLVNGYPVQEIVLRPGDLISLATVDIVYAEDSPTKRARTGDTQPFTKAET